MTKYIASCSGGKDSVATLIIARENGDPLDEVVYCEVMFDKETSGEMPEHRDFIYNKVKPYVEDVLNVPFIILRPTKTYVDVFTHICVKGKSIGKCRGFPIPGMCAINRDCKIPPITKYWKEQGGNATQYVGIAADEPKRLARLRGTSRVSLLEKYGVTEQDAFEICRKHGLLSPIYEFSKRNGCWFCPNCRNQEWTHLIFNHTPLFDRLIELEINHPERARRCLTINETASEVKQKIIRQGEQCSLF